MTRLTFPTYLDHIRSESATFRAALAGCDPTAPVPACPDWKADDLLWHLGEVQWFWATAVRTRPTSPDDNGIDPPQRPDTPAGLLEFFDAASADLVAQLEAADPAEPAWTWAPEQTVGFTFRRQAHEALIHRLDAEQAAGLPPTPLDAALAADGVAELLEVMYGGEPPTWAGFRPVGGLVRVDVADAQASLWVQPGELGGRDPDSDRTLEGPHLVVVDDPDAAPAAVVTGTAAAMDAYYWKRADQAPQVSGDEQTAAAFAAALSPPLD